MRSLIYNTGSSTVSQCTPTTYRETVPPYHSTSDGFSREPGLRQRAVSRTERDPVMAGADQSNAGNQTLRVLLAIWSIPSLKCRSNERGAVVAMTEYLDKHPAFLAHCALPCLDPATQPLPCRSFLMHRLKTAPV